MNFLTDKAKSWEDVRCIGVGKILSVMPG